MCFLEFDCDVMDGRFGDAVDFHEKDSWKFLGTKCHGFGCMGWSVLA